WLAQSQMRPARYDLTSLRFRDPGFGGFLQQLRDLHPERKDRPRLRMEWPGANLSLTPMRALVGDTVDVLVDADVGSLVLDRGARSFIGLPAVCLAMAQRSRLSWIVAYLLLPFAVALESVRRSMSLMPMAR